MRRMTAMLIGLCCGIAWGQQDGHGDSLKASLQAIATEARGKVQISCALPGTVLDCDLDAHARPPMQSVFKLPLVFTMLHQIDQGRFQLDQPIHFLNSDRDPGMYSPLQDEHPQGEFDVPLRELMRRAVSQSDNAAADLLLRLLGGPPVVEAYLHSIGIAAFQLKDSERAMHHDQTLQYRNWWEPVAAVTFLRQLQDRSALSPASTALVRAWMEATATGPHRIKAGLPVGTVVLHKTGTSGEEHGLAPATNDMALIRLPDGRMLALAVFVTDARADEATRDAVIARVAGAVYAEAVQDAAEKSHSSR